MAASIVGSTTHKIADRNIDLVDVDPGLRVIAGAGGKAGSEDGVADRLDINIKHWD